MKKNKIKVLTIIALSLFCLTFVGCKKLNAKIFENNGRFISIKDNIPSSSILLHSEELFDAGGINVRSGKIIPAQLYNLKTHKSKIVGKLNIPRTNYSQVLLNDGRVLILGGQTVDKFGQLMKPVKMAEVYNSKTKTFFEISDTNFAHGYNTHSVLLQDSRVFIIESGLVEIYNPKTEIFTIAGELKEYNFKQFGQEYIKKYSTLNKFLNSSIPVPLKDGRVLIVGESYDGGNAELYDPKINSFIPTGQMKYSRSQFTATLLKDGRVLITGGVNKEHSVGIALAEIFNPETNTFTSSGSLKQTRYNHSAILLSNGKVLIVNGSYGNSLELKDLKEAELFDPKTETFKKIGSSYGPRMCPELINMSDNQVLIPFSIKTEIYQY